MKRIWNVIDSSPSGEISGALSELADHNFLRFIFNVCEADRVYVAAVRAMFDAEGNRVPEEAERETEGNWETVGYAFTFNDESEPQQILRGEAFASEAIEAVADAGAAAALADLLSEAIGVNFLRAMLQLKVLLDGVGGQAYIDRVEGGYVFAYQHRDYRIIRVPFPVLGEDDPGKGWRDGRNADDPRGPEGSPEPDIRDEPAPIPDEPDPWDEEEEDEDEESLPHPEEVVAEAPDGPEPNVDEPTEAVRA